MKERIFTTKEQGRVLVETGLPISTASGHRSCGVDRLYSMEDNAGRVSLAEVVTPDVSNPVWDVGMLLNLKHIHRKNMNIHIHENMKQVTRIRYKTEDNPPMANVPLIGYSKKYDCWVALVYRKGDNYYTNMERDVEYKTSPPDEYEYVYP